MECGMSKFQGRAMVEESECTALIWALRTSWNLGYRKVEFDGDNLNIIRLINGKDVTPRLRHYLDEIWHWRSMFTETKFTFHHREQNKCADILARQAQRSLDDGFLFHSCPNFLVTVVNAEAG
ncbi:putative ribonuclease H domain-containing protein [Arabidopsis thaliana]